MKKENERGEENDNGHFGVNQLNVDSGSAPIPGERGGQGHRFWNRSSGYVDYFGGYSAGSSF